MSRPPNLSIDCGSDRREHASQLSTYSSGPSACYSSNSTSPAPSLFSKHQRYGSSASSLSISPPVATTLTDPFGVSKTLLTDVKEEPPDGELTLHTINLATAQLPHANQASQDYFSHHAFAAVPPMDEVSVDLTEVPRQRQSDTSSVRISRLSTRHSTASSLRKTSKASSPPPLDKLSPLPQRPSRTGSVSSTFGGSSARRFSAQSFTNLYGDSSDLSVEITEKSEKKRDNEPEATEDRDHQQTPLLPPIVTELEEPEPLIVASPLESPSVASSSIQICRTVPRKVVVSRLVRSNSEAQASRLSARPSLAHSRYHSSEQIIFGRPRPEQPTIAMPDCDDGWSLELGHANFVIHPQPYIPSINSIESIEAHFADWQTARSNYAKHLARVSKFYGQTSSTYKLTEEKWATIEKEWKANHDLCLSRYKPESTGITRLKPSGNSSATLAQLQSSLMGGTAKLPTIDDSKFPDLGDQDIIGLMTVEKPKAQVSVVKQSSSVTPPKRKRQFFRALMSICRPRNNR
ncbi:hypothetical protein KEM56_006887 [Ascosphaera pollenicola]|nr:hypothetical protein KEM56_006887 [Ascosphaera pollenicola]